MQRYDRDLEPDEVEPEEEMVELTTELRLGRGLGPLRYSIDLFAAARLHAEYLAETSSVSHKGSGGSNVGHRVKGVGYYYSVIAENVGSAPTTKIMFNLWIDSKGHKKNMLIPGVEDVGVGIAEDFRGQKYWVLLLGKRLGS